MVDVQTDATLKRACANSVAAKIVASTRSAMIVAVSALLLWGFQSR